MGVCVNLPNIESLMFDPSIGASDLQLWNHGSERFDAFYLLSWQLTENSLIPEERAGIRAEPLMQLRLNITFHWNPSGGFFSTTETKREKRVWRVCPGWRVEVRKHDNIRWQITTKSRRRPSVCLISISHPSPFNRLQHDWQMYLRPHTHTHNNTDTHTH